MPEMLAACSANLHFLAVGELRLYFVIHDQQVSLAGGIHAKGVKDVERERKGNAAGWTHLSLASSNEQKVFTTLPDCDVIELWSNTPSHCKNAMAGSGEAWGRALSIAWRTASLSCSPLRKRGRGSAHRSATSCELQHLPARRSLDDSLDQLWPGGRDVAGLVVEETDGLEGIHRGAEASVAQRAPVHALHALEAVFVDVGQRIAVVELL